jgi:hypothetical protein
VTISTTRTDELSVAEIITSAFERAGLKNEAEDLDEVRQAKGRRELKLILDALSTHGKVARLTVQTAVPLVLDQRDYTLAVGTIDVDGVATVDSLIVSPMTRQEQMILENNETESGAPQRYYVDRTGAAPVLQLYPAPNAEYATQNLLIQREVFRADVRPGSVTPDVERYWVQAIVFALAETLALGAGLLNRAGYLKGRAEETLKLALGKAAPRGATMATLCVPNLWRNR